MNRTILYAIALFILLSLCFSSPSFGAPACSFVGVFSNLALDENTGDISGDEIIVTLSPQGHEAIFTEAQGGFPIKPIVADAKIVNGWITFKVNIDPYTVKVMGKPTCKYLYTTFEWSTGSKYSIKIPRTKSFWDTSGK